MFGNTSTSMASKNLEDSLKVGAWEGFHFHNFVELKTEQVDTSVDMNALSNIVTPLPRGHRDKDVEKFRCKCVTKYALQCL